MNKLPSRGDIVGEETLFQSLIAILMGIEVLFAISNVLYFSLLGWLILFWLAKDWAGKRAETLDTLAAHLDAPVTDWPPMTLDQFKWMLWNCDLQGRTITQEEVRAYFLDKIEPRLQWEPLGRAIRIADGFGVAGSRLPKSHYELIEEPRSKVLETLNPLPKDIYYL